MKQKAIQETLVTSMSYECFQLHADPAFFLHLLPCCDRNHVKPQVRAGEVTSASITPVPLESLTGLRSPQPPAPAATTNPVQTASDLSSAFSHLSSSSSSLDPSDDSGMPGRGR